MSNPGYRFENELLNALRDSFPNTFSYRFKQSKRTGQPWDLLVLPPHLCAIECKSKDITGRKTLKLEQLFREGQLEDELAKSRQYNVPAILCLELRRGRGYPKRCYYTNLSNVYETTVRLNNMEMKPIPRENGRYQIPDNFPNLGDEND